MYGGRENLPAGRFPLRRNRRLPHRKVAGNHLVGLRVPAAVDVASRAVPADLGALEAAPGCSVAE